MLSKTTDEIFKLNQQITSLVNENSVKAVNGHKKCPNCDTENSENAHFCHSCRCKI